MARTSILATLGPARETPERLTAVVVNASTLSGGSEVTNVVTLHRA